MRSFEEQINLLCSPQPTMVNHSHAAYDDVTNIMSVQRSAQPQEVVFFGCSWRRSCFHCSNSSQLLKRNTPLGLIGLGNKLRAVRCRRSKRSQYDGRFFPPTVFILGSFIGAIIAALA